MVLFVFVNTLNLMIFKYDFMFYFRVAKVRESNQLDKVSPGLDLLAMSFTEFLSVHGKQYGDQTEFNERMKIFQENLEYIEAHNADPKHSFKLGLNQFSDLTEEEFLD